MTCPYCGVEIPLNDLSYRRLENHMRTHTGGLLEAANRLADARVRYAQEFGRLKLANPGMTDKAAMFAATENTNDEVTRLEAELVIAKGGLS